MEEEWRRKKSHSYGRRVKKEEVSKLWKEGEEGRSLKVMGGKWRRKKSHSYGRRVKTAEVSHLQSQIFWNKIYRLTIHMTESQHANNIDLLCHWVLDDKTAHNLHCWCGMDWLDISAVSLRKHGCLLENPLNVLPSLSCWHLCVSQLGTPHVVASLSSRCSYHKQWLQMGRWLQISKPK